MCYKKRMNKIVVAYKQYGCGYRKYERIGKLSLIRTDIKFRESTAHMISIYYC